MTDILWLAIAVQVALGAFDTLYHHEGTERLAWRASQETELRLHGVRNVAYAVMFLTLGWREPSGAWALTFAGLLLAELFITLWDFVEEDRTRLLPATERVTHTLLTLNYGIILAMLLPWLVDLTEEPTALTAVDHGVRGWLCVAAAAGVLLFGVRDLIAAARCKHLVSDDAAGLCSSLGGRQSVLVTGATGFVGSRLVEALVDAGHAVTVLTRARVSASALSLLGPVRVVTSLDELPGDTRVDAVINLAGEPISNGLWTRAKRARIVRSRVEVTDAVVALIARLERRPAVLVSGSAIGWYGLRGDEWVAEDSEGRACFSHEVCRQWEGRARQAAALGVRTVLLRTGLVLDRDGGLLARMLTPFEFGLGGRFGRGNQWMSWIHRDDLVRMIMHAVATPALSGAVNGVAPEPVRNRKFARTLARALHRPALMPVPAWPLRLALSDLADELLLGGQRVRPEAALESGFKFWHSTLQSALNVIVGNEPPRAEEAPQGALMLTRSSVD